MATTTAVFQNAMPASNDVADSLTITRASIPEDTQPLADSPSASAPVLGG